MAGESSVAEDILIVEDNMDLAEIIHQMLVKQGKPSCCVQTGGDARGWLAEHNPPLMVLDYSLPDMTAAKLAEDLSGRVPFIVTTGVGSEHIAVEMMKLGARDYLVKDAAFADSLPTVIDRVLRELAMEQKLKAAEADLHVTQFAMDHAGQAIMWIAPEGTIQYANLAAGMLLGRGAEILTGKKIGEFHREYTPECWEKIWLDLKRQGILKVEQVIRDEAGVQHYLDITMNYIFLENREFSIYYLRDITEERKIQEQLMHAQKMEAIGQLAGGVAHDFNNLLMGILGYAGILKQDLEPGTPAQKAAVVIGQAAERAAELTKKLLSLSRSDKTLNIPVRIHPLLEETVLLLERTLGKNLRLVKEFGAEEDLVLGDPNQIQQVILNLAVNARDAMPHGGEIRLATHVEDCDEARVPFQIAPGRFVVLTLSDLGCGIPLELHQRIFEPMFTTKRSGKGTGMGLALVYTIVKNHKGFVRMESEVGRGSAFHVYLPVHSGTQGGKCAETDIASPALHGCGKLLVVDDEPMVRHVAARMLRGLGYEVLEAADGLEALHCFRQYGHEIDAVLLDMVMPGVSGWECFQALRHIRNTVRIVLSSGYGPDDDVMKMLRMGAAGFVQKPYGVNELSQVMAGALEKA
jgi:PAS domain S-box-containing protein